MVTCAALLGFLLLRPSQGTGLLDHSILPVGLARWEYCTIIVLQVIVGLALCARLSANGDCGKDVLRCCWLLLLFSVLVAVSSIRVFSVGSLVCGANICLSAVCFHLALWLSLQSMARRLIPDAFTVTLVAYSLVVVYHLVRPECLCTLSRGMKYYFDGKPRLSVIFGHPNHLGNVLAFGSLLCYSRVVASRSRVSQALLWVLLAVLVAGLVATYSRGAWLGFVVGLVASALYMYKRVTTSRLAASMLALTVIVLISVFTLSSHAAQERLGSTSPEADDSVRNRVAVWRSTMPMIRDHWLVGVGIGTFGDAFDRRYRPPDLGAGKYASALNNYITCAAEAGIPGILLYLCFLVYACIAGSRRVSGAGWRVGTQIGLLCGVYSMLVFGMTTYTLARVYYGVVVGCAMGYLNSLQPCRDGLGKSRTDQEHTGGGRN